MKGFIKFCLSGAIAVGFHFLPLGDTLTPQAHGILSTLLFMVLLWVTEAVSYPVSSFFLIVSMTLFTAFAVSPETGKLIGAQRALGASLNGFRSGAWILVVSALFLAGAIQKSGLGHRIGLFILSKVGGKPRQIRAGILFMCFALTLFIPAQAANAALMTAVCVGLIEVFGLERQDNFAKGMLLIVAFGTGLAGMGVLTSGAPPIQTAEFIAQATGRQISWLEWMFYGMPFAVLMGLALLLLVECLFPVKNDEMAGGREAIAGELKKLGPLSTKERNLLIIMFCIISLWATGKILHPLDSSTVALLGVAAMIVPGISVTNWKDMNSVVNWGTLMLFGAAISLGQALLSTGAAAWVAKETLVSLGVGAWSPLAIIGTAGLFFAVFSLAFSARSAAVAALVPTAIGFAEALPKSAGLSTWGLTLILYYTIQFSLILPVNTPMSMVAYSTNTFTAREMAKVGVPLCVIAILGMMLFSETYWRWVGVL
jgi:anion transporter